MLDRIDDRRDMPIEQFYDMCPAQKCDIVEVTGRGEAVKATPFLMCPLALYYLI